MAVRSARNRHIGWNLFPQLIGDRQNLRTDSAKSVRFRLFLEGLGYRPRMEVAGNGTQDAAPQSFSDTPVERSMAGDSGGGKLPGDLVALVAFVRIWLDLRSEPSGIISVGWLEKRRLNMYERFTDRARKVMQLANQEAQRFNHEYIGTEHILLGLVKEGSGVAANVLKNLDVDLRKIRMEVEKIVQAGPDMVTMGKASPHTPSEESYRIRHRRGA